MMIQSQKICCVCSSAPSYSAARNLYSKHQDSPQSELNVTGNKFAKNAQCSMLGHLAKECQKALLFIKILGINNLVVQNTHVPNSPKGKTKA